MNAKEELLKKIQQIQEWLGDTELICATISHDPFIYGSGYESKSKSFDLKKGYTPSELKEFLNSIDFDYDAGYGLQELYGHVWFTNGIWMDRHEYDGSEYWDIHRYPAIPYELQNN